jgi:hypothetical protein
MLAAAAAVTALAATVVTGTSSGAAPAAPAQAPAPASGTLGVANALAQSYRFNPRAGSLSVGIGFGISLADFQNFVSRGESRAIDLGIIGTLLAAQGCSGGDPTLPAEQQPQPLHAEARGEPQTVTGEDLNGLMTKFVTVTPQPSSQAITTTAARDIVPGVLAIGAGRSETRTQFIDGVREAIAISDISSLTLLGGAVKLVGLHWEAIHRSGATEESIGTFSIGSATKDGLNLPLNELGIVLDSVRQAVAPFGVNLSIPTSFNSGGIQFVEPLKVGFIPSKLREALLLPVLSLLQPVRNDIALALFEADCRTEDVVTVADIATGTLTGQGDFNLELGGVQATSRDLVATCFFCPKGGISAATPVAPIALPSISTPSAPSLPSLPPAVATPVAAATTPAVSRPAAPASTVDEKRGGALAAVAGIGLALMVAVAEADRRKMRAAQRLVPVEA